MVTNRGHPAAKPLPGRIKKCGWSLIGATALAQVALGGAALAQCPTRAGYPQNWCISRADPAAQRVRPYRPPGPTPQKRARPYSYVPKSPQNPYGQAPPSAGLSSSVQRPYSVPRAPDNPYDSVGATAPYYAPARSQMPYPQPGATALPPSTIRPQARYSYKCVVNDRGDFCNATTSAPANIGDECTCGGIDGYVE